MSNAENSNSTTQPLHLTHETITSLPSTSFPNPSKGTCSWRTLISSPSTSTNSFTVGIASCPTRKPHQEGYLALHRHAQAEIYHIISGRGIVVIDGVEREVGGGDVVFIPGDAEHGVWNLDEGSELRWLYCFAVDGFGDVVYRFSADEKGEGEGEDRLVDSAQLQVLRYQFRTPYYARAARSSGTGAS